MGVSRIEQLIEDIYEFVESCKMQPLSSTKVIVPKDELYDLLDELRLRTPDEIKRYQKIIANRDAILADAELKSSTMLAEAQEKTNSLISEHEIMQQAYYQANELVEQASNEANRVISEAHYEADEIRKGSLAYAEDMLGDVERVLYNAYDNSKSKYGELLETLKGNLDIVSSNKKELVQQSGGETQDYKVEQEDQPEDIGEFSDEEFDFDENTFLDGID